MPDSVRLMHYDPRWPQEFEQTRSGILHSCLGWVVDVRHIGSTAVGGLVARPVIDVLAIVNDDAEMQQALDESSAMMEGLNFRRIEPPMWAAETIVLAKPRAGEMTHRVFLTYSDSPFVRSSTLIQDRLSSDRELSLRFEETKVARWRAGEGNPEKYASDKAVFFAYVIEHAG